MACPALDHLADEFAEQRVQSIFVYTREAHPGENYPHHTSFEQKLALAREFRDLFSVRRPILVDDLEGTVHKAFGRLPNMTYILAPDNRVVFRSDWTDPDTVRAAPEYLMAKRSKRRKGKRLAPFYAEIEGSRSVDHAAFNAGLARNGPKAVTEFADAQKRWARGEHLGGITRRS